MSRIEVRHTVSEDYERILEIYEIARQFMREAGNPNQWGDSWPPVATIADDIKIGRNYVITEDGVIKGVFAFIIGEDPTYQYIEDGSWHYDSTYGTIHRIASDGTLKGLSKICFDYCFTQIDYLRIDTHKDNIPMQSAVKKYGFERCGIIYVEDGSPRIAFDIKKSNS